MGAEAFGDVSEAYEAMIDWPRRLANEEPLYRWVFEQVGAQSVLDAACGTGHHAAMFQSWGLRVQGADISPEMIERCRRRWGQGGSLQWVVRSYTESHRNPQGLPESFDVVVCLGNSLALAGDKASMARAMQTMFDAVRPGGAMVIHAVNLWNLPDGPCVWQKCLRSELSGRPVLIIKGVHRAGDRGYVELLVADLSSPVPDFRSHCAEFLGLEADDLKRICLEAGAGRVEVYGSHRRQPYNRSGSPDLILVALKRS